MSSNKVAILRTLLGTVIVLGAIPMPSIGGMATPRLDQHGCDRQSLPQHQTGATPNRIPESSISSHAGRARLAGMARVCESIEGAAADGEISPLDSINSSANDRVIEMPPGPGSLSLALSGLLTCALAGGFSHLREAHFGGPLPDWYHADARPIGHSTPYVPGPVILLPCFQPGLEMLPRPERPDARLADRVEAHFFIPNLSPRSPPHNPMNH